MAEYIGLVNKGRKKSSGLLRLPGKIKGFEQWDEYFESDQLEILTNSSFKVKVKKYNHPSKGIYCFVMGNVFINPEVAKVLIKKHELPVNPEDESLIPFLLSDNVKDVLTHLTGNFNLIVHDQVLESVYIISSRFGMIPLYYYENSDHIYFSSKVHLLTQSELFQPAIDYVSWLEQFIYNHFPGEYTGIKNIKLLPPASCLAIRKELNPNIEKYWRTDELLNIEKPFDKTNGLELIDDTIRNTLKKFMGRISHPALTLTGGWDGRLALSYISELTDDFFLYSFGAKESSDIRIPMEISQKLNFRYTPIILDDRYLKDDFLHFGKKTIIESDGMRPFTRAHYLYAIEQVSQETQFLISGNCGSNILKTSKRANNLLNQNLLDLIEKGTVNDKIITGIGRTIANSPFANVTSDMKDELISRLSSYEITNRRDLSPNQRFYLFLLDDIERKYFGVEAKTYNRNLENFSFFIDYDFLKALSQTVFFGTHLPFYHNSIKYRYLTTWLYAKLIKRNNSNLSAFISDKGFSLDEALNPAGKLKAIYIKNYNKYIHKLRPVDTFNTKPTEDIFKDFLIGQNMIGKDDSQILEILSKGKRADYMSWIYWKNNEL